MIKKLIFFLFSLLSFSVKAQEIQVKSKNHSEYHFYYNDNNIVLDTLKSIWSFEISIDVPKECDNLVVHYEAFAPIDCDGELQFRGSDGAGVPEWERGKITSGYSYDLVYHRSGLKDSSDYLRKQITCEYSVNGKTYIGIIYFSIKRI